MDRLITPASSAPDLARSAGAKRARQRDSLFLAATLKVGGIAEPAPVRVRNLSEGGLMADLPQGAAVGAPVELELRGIGHVTGHVAWCTAGRIGVAFDREIDPKKARKPVGKVSADDEWRKPMGVR